MENEGRQDVISGSEIGLEYRAGTETEKLLKDQNGFAWPKAFFTENSRKVSVNVSYNEESLNQRISQLFMSADRADTGRECKAGI